jgi:hypothetical protein
MKKIIFEVYDDMFSKIDEAAVKEGFLTRSEFLRFLIVSYFKGHGIEQQNEMPLKKETEKKEESRTLLDEFPNVNLEYGIPPEVMEKIKKMANVKC